jgi:hypothetical protein
MPTVSNLLKCPMGNFCDCQHHYWLWSIKFTEETIVLCEWQYFMPIQQTNEKNKSLTWKVLDRQLHLYSGTKLGRIRICTKLYYGDVDIHYEVSLAVSGAALSTRTFRPLLSVVSVFCHHHKYTLTQQQNSNYWPSICQD